jgi:pimeloyl-ACP methyl ester carboxylesterase
MPAITSHDGLSIAYEVSGDPAVLFVHANGFCKEVWNPVIRALGGSGFVAIDQRGHGDSDAPTPPFDWWDFARDGLAVLEAVGARNPIGVGHSSGGAALAMAEILRPGTFARLVLIEPIVFPPPYRRVESHPLITGALRRRSAFPALDDIFSTYRGRGPFMRWTDDALRDYVAGGFRYQDSTWVLKCSPAVEAEVYRTSEMHGAWDRLGEIGCRVDLVAGADSDSHPEAFVRRQVEQFTDGHLHTVAAASHFVPMEQPGAVATIIATG